MADERDKVLKKNIKKDEAPDVEAHKKEHVNEEKSSEEEIETPDVEAHKVPHKLQH
jgi:hypothetical protein